MNWKSKLITLDGALGMVKSGDNIITGMAASEAKAFLSRIHEIAPRVRDVEVVTCLPMSDYPFFADPQYKESFLHSGWFFTAAMRRSHAYGNTTFIPNHLHVAARKRLDYRVPSIYIGSAAMPDRHGNVSLSLSVTYETEIIKAADVVILEINPNFPRTFGDAVVPCADVDYFIETDYQPGELSIAAPNEKDKIIGDYIADLVEDGATIQLGVGGIPNAVAAALRHKRDLGVHTEMITDGMVDLIESGTINGKRKSLCEGKAIGTFAMGTRRLYDFLDDNPAVELRRGCWVNDPCVIGQNYKMVSINTAIEIDLFGQVCSESIGTRQFSGAGGQADTAIGAQNSPGGKSIIALYSTAMVKTGEGDARQPVSKIVPTLAPGAAVTLSRADVDYVVTEYGVAALRGTPIRERVKRLTAIAHPDFKEDLIKQAHEQHIW